MTKFAIPVASHARREVIALLAALMAINALAVDIVLPALPDITAALRVTTENQQQFIVLIYLMGFGAAQFFYGPILDRFGRRMPLMVGLAIYITAGTLCVFAPNMGTLLALRFIQGAGAAGTRVVAQTVTRDLFKGRAMAEVMSLVQMVFMMIPILAPGLGQLVMLFTPWQGVFWFMVAFGITVTAWCLVRLPETLAAENRRSLSFASIAEGFSLVFSNRIAMGYMIASAFLFGGALGFISTVQQLYVDVYHLGPWFPLAFAGSAVTMALAAYLNSRVVGRFGMRRIAHLGVLLSIACAGILTVSSLFGPVPLWVFIPLISGPIFAMGWTAGNMVSLAMEPLGKVAGSASAIFGSVQTLGGALLGSITGHFFNNTITPIVSGFLVFGICALIAILIAEKGKLFGVGTQQPV